MSMASGPARTWEWRPEQPGLYRVRGVLTDGLGNRLAGDWSEPFRIEPPLRIEALSSDRPAPQAALTVSVTWSISAFGGVAPLRYTFELARNDEAGRPVQEGAEAGWQWNPDREGEYRVRVDIEDARGNRVAGSWSPPYAIAPPIAISVPEPDNPADQSLLESRIRWQAQESGGVGSKTIAFLLEKETGKPSTVQTGSSGSWTWRPEEVGRYRVSASMTDSLGNRKESAWSAWKEIRAPLAVTTLVPSLPSPRAVLGGEISWSAETTGGIGGVTYQFRSVRNGVESIEQEGPSPQWAWTPRKAGIYKIKFKAWDEENHVAESAWSDEYRMEPAIKAKSLVAVFPLENLSDAKAPLRDIGEKYSNLLRAELELLPADILEEFMRRHHMRDTGGSARRMLRPCAPKRESKQS